jgi:uncharacterized protein
MSRRLCIVPRWGGTQESEWYPWLRAQDEVLGRFDEIVGPEIAVPGTPTIDAWMASLTAACGTGRDPASAENLARTWFVGHSVGCQAVLRYLASVPAGVRTAGCVLVAGWWTVDEPWESLQPWLYPPGPTGVPAGVPALGLDHVRAASRRFLVLISDNDPFTADWQATKAAWQERLGATVRVIPGAKHFNATEAPVVVDALLELTEPA